MSELELVVLVLEVLLALPPPVLEVALVLLAAPVVLEACEEAVLVELMELADEVTPVADEPEALLPVAPVAAPMLEVTPVEPVLPSPWVTAVVPLDPVLMLDDAAELELADDGPALPWPVVGAVGVVHLESWHCDPGGHSASEVQTESLLDEQLPRAQMAPSIAPMTAALRISNRLRP